MKSLLRLACALVVLASCAPATSAPRPETSVAPTITPTTEASPAPSVTTGTTDGEAFHMEIVVVGDFGSGDGREYDVADAMRATITGQGVDLFLTTGDNFYSDDIEEIWTRPYGWLYEEGIPVVVAWGNHDVETDTRQALVQETLRPPGRWYSMPLGPGTLLVLDSNQVDNPDQVAWMTSQLERATPPVIISFHHPAYSCGVYADYDDVRDNWVPIFEGYDVALVLNGHEHHYERFDVDDRTYVVTGGGGHRIRDRHDCAPETPEPLASNYEDSHFLMLRIGEGVIQGEALDTDGQVIDRFSVDY